MAGETEISFVGLSGEQNVEAEIPSLGAVAEFLERVDGFATDQLYVEFSTRGSASYSVCLFHGLDGLAVLHASTGGDWAYLTRLSADAAFGGDELVSAVNGGSEVPVKRSWLTPFDYAVRNLWYFIATGRFNPDAEWDRTEL